MYRLTIHPLILGSPAIVLPMFDLAGSGEPGSGKVHQVVRVLLGEQLVDDDDAGVVVRHLDLKGTKLAEGISLMNQNTLVVLYLRCPPIQWFYDFFCEQLMIGQPENQFPNQIIATKKMIYLKPPHDWSMADCLAYTESSFFTASQILEISTWSPAFINLGCFFCFFKFSSSK